MDAPNLEGRTALVTGGGRGIGRATCIALARRGARVVVVARSENEIEDVASEIQSAGGQAEAIACDISDEPSVKQLADTAAGVDILINNAGAVHPIAPIVSVDFSDWRRNIGVNLDGVFLTCRYLVPGMVERRWGRVVNVTAGAVKGNQTAWGAYSAAKGAVEVLTKVLAREVGDKGVHANVVRPGIVDTDMQRAIRDTDEREFGRENLERFRGYKERGLLRNPEDPARLILWLLSADGDGTNGEVLIIDDPEVAARVGLQPMGR